MIAKNKILLIIIGFLLITNIGMLIFLLGNKPADKPATAVSRQGGFAETLQKEIGFNEDQITTYKTMREKHRAEMKPLFEQLRQTKTAFYGKVYSYDENPVTLDSIARPIGDQQAALDKKLFLYFTQLRKLCTPEQVSRFDSILPQVVARMTGGVRRDHDRNAPKNSSR